jgi:hypothetical protein
VIDSSSPSRQPSRQPVQHPLALSSFAPPPASLTLTGSLHRNGDRLSLQYRLEDQEGLVLLPPATAAPRRCDELWTTTCFELFLAEPGAEPYWEVNLSPSGDWNVYRLSGYREGLAPEPAIVALPFVVEPGGGGFELTVTLDLGALPLAGRPLELAVTAVVELQGGEILYWALAHQGEEADFHRRDGFLLRI